MLNQHKIEQMSINNNDGDETSIDFNASNNNAPENKDAKNENKESKDKKEEKGSSIKKTIAGAGVATGAAALSALEAQPVVIDMGGEETAAADSTVQDVAAEAENAQGGAENIISAETHNTLYAKQNSETAGGSVAENKGAQSEAKFADETGAPESNTGAEGAPAIGITVNVNVVNETPGMVNTTNGTGAEGMYSEPTVSDTQNIDQNGEPTVNDTRNIGGEVNNVPDINGNSTITQPDDDLSKMGGPGDEPTVQDLTAGIGPEIQVVQMPDGEYDTIVADENAAPVVDTYEMDNMIEEGGAEIVNVDTVEGEPTVSNLELAADDAIVQVVEMPDGSFDTISNIDEGQPTVTNISDDSEVTVGNTMLGNDGPDLTTPANDDFGGGGDDTTLDDISSLRGH